MATAILSFLISGLLGKLLIPLLHKLKFGQNIRDVGPAWHKNKQGTPTMGGLLFIIGIAVSLALAMPLCELLRDRISLPYSIFYGISGSPVFTDPLTNTRLVAGLILMAACGLIGFADDYISVVKKRSLGLSSLQKLAAQMLVGFGYAMSLYMAGDARQDIPFVGRIDLGIFFIPACMFTVVAMTNAANLTDGVDGLCGSVSFTAAIPFLILTSASGALGQGLLAGAFCGGMLGYLIWNLHPARVMMGDTGSLFIGGTLCALAFGIGKPLLLIPAGLVYIAEALSVTLQVVYFKLTHGKRLFKMSPIHHHFEMCGWRENKIVLVFSAITLLGGAAALLIDHFGG